MKLIIFCIFFSLTAQASVYFEANWSQELKKELTVSCDNGSQFCERLCSNANQCVIAEGACRDCIGTSLVMTNLLNEMGRTIVNSGELSIESQFLELILTNQFVTLSPNDVYNVIDAAGSVRAMKKFEKLCPEGSLDQLLFLKVNAYTRRIIAPEAVYCLMEEGSLIYNLTGRPDVIINERQLSPLN